VKRGVPTGRAARSVLIVRQRRIGSEVLYLTNEIECEISVEAGSSEMDLQQKRIYQSMPPEKKLRLALKLYHSARELKTAALRRDHPDWTEKEIHERIREIFLFART
jgi:hypothetical protein